MMIAKDIFIRILKKDDINTTTIWLNDPIISDIMGYLPTFTLEQQYEWYQKLINDKSRYVFAICENKSGKQIGNVALGNIDYFNRNAAFSIFIYKKIKRGKGYGTQATRLCLDFAFNRLNLHKVYLRTSERFIEAIKMYEKIGFIKEGVMREHYFSNGHYEDKILYSILSSEYLKHE